MTQQGFAQQYALERAEIALFYAQMMKKLHEEQLPKHAELVGEVSYFYELWAEALHKGHHIVAPPFERR